MSSAWNYNYLEAIGLPVWVTRDAPVAKEHTEKSQVSKDETLSTTEPSVDTDVSISIIMGSETAQYLWLVSPTQDLQRVKDNFMSLDSAWKQWQGTDLPVALVVQSNEQDQESVGSNQSCLSKSQLSERTLLFSQDSDLNHHNVMQAPNLDWQTAEDKKACWQLLQSIAQPSNT